MEIQSNFPFVIAMKLGIWDQNVINLLQVIIINYKHKTSLEVFCLCNNLGKIKKNFKQQTSFEKG